VALARKDYADAVRQFEALLAADKNAAAVHYPLAMAYRGLGDLKKAEAHLAERRDGDIAPPDPLIEELRGLVESVAAYERRGTEALNSGDWATAVAQFRKGLAIKPTDPALRHRLGTALAQTGDTSGAVEQFEQVVRTSPQYARAHYSLGILDQASGRPQKALDRFTAAVQSDPDYVEARLALAALMRRSGRALASIEHYQHVLKVDPRVPDAAFGYAMALVSLGRYQEARDRLSKGTVSYPDHTGFPHALARVLAAAPDARVRDGQRAMALMKPLLDQQQTLELGETMAMTLAEVGQYQEAAAFQRSVIAAAERSGLGDLARRMTDNLRLYERRQPCRTPWREGELP
jgi:tetratricopeptide (TPR) repeat protein